MSQSYRHDPSKFPGDKPSTQPGAQPTGAATPAQGPTQGFEPPEDVTSGLDAFAADAELERLRGDVAAAEAKAKEHYEAYVRAHAEMENVRRRAQEEASKSRKFAIEDFANSLLAVRDSLELALTAEQSPQAMREGVEATLKQLSSVFERNKVLEINPVGQKFDPHLHQAISMVPGGSVHPPVPPNHVVTVLQKGYALEDRVLRPALVTVAQA